MRADKELFDRLASGTANAMAAALRGVVDAEGDLQLIVQFQRLFPGPPPGGDDRDEAGYARRRPMSDELVQILDGNTFVVSDDAR